MIVIGVSLLSEVTSLLHEKTALSSEGLSVTGMKRARGQLW